MMKFLYALLLCAAVQAQVTTTTTERAASVAAPEITLDGTMYNASDDWGLPTWVTVFDIGGAFLHVPHDPSLGSVAMVTSAAGSWIVDIGDVGAGPVFKSTAGSGLCWAIPYGPPDPDGTWPVQPEYKKIVGHGSTLYGAVADYKAQVTEALSEGWVPSPGNCD